ncbi:EF-P lysine aminoacylase EpmA [Kushneria phosphatilytica]|uniref:EF-P lysine aminoacylase GenX n=1 Tax=Kushneria phosphatilytica TaxID=657387 RepID=A0A1S1NUS5_9GAMM|nr:EF-P lysine aminoacylase EpmA [Kushneria phosphatilytica]OHV09976.1 EF-P lysine aminoacylase GenX [Kushneria phosphatilytica]QEL11656.1 EF-P lysine aminoacylase GenX [Kushneria phosphatilytica]
MDKSVESWRPSAAIETLCERARLLAEVRRFFAERGVLEVETPVLGHAGSTEVHLDSLSTEATTPAGRERLWLQTSPEFHMKRLLAAGSGPIFQLARSFRNGEVGRRHNLEFTMLEWYRPAWSLKALVDETEALIRTLLPSAGVRRLRRYRSLFREMLDVDPFTASLAALQHLAGEWGGIAMDDIERDGCLDLLMSMAIEPQLGRDGIDIVIDYPPSQAALARHVTDVEGDRVAARFEVYVDGLELANGYDELVDASEQAERFAEDNRARARLGKPLVESDRQLVAALEAGLPESSGVALGIDRLIQLALGRDSIAEVMAFPTSRC